MKIMARAESNVLDMGFLKYNETFYGKLGHNLRESLQDSAVIFRFGPTCHRNNAIF